MKVTRDPYLVLFQQARYSLQHNMGSMKDHVKNVVEVCRHFNFDKKLCSECDREALQGSFFCEDHATGVELERISQQMRGGKVKKKKNEFRKAQLQPHL